MTFGNQSAGVYSSYVTDVCRYWNKELNIDVKILAFISLRGFYRTKKERKELYKKTFILPMVPFQNLWWLNIFLLVFVWPFIGESKIMALSPIAGNLAMLLKKLRLIKEYSYDAEGATAAEWNEYNVVPSSYLKKRAYKIEARALKHAKKIRTVSNKMIKYWQTHLGFVSNNYVVIPCKLNQLFVKDLPSYQDLISKRKNLGYSESDVIFCYAGSSAGWQSLDLLSNLFSHPIVSHPNFKFIFLTDSSPDDISLYRDAPHKVSVLYVPYHKVIDYLQICDYGTLIREPSITNMVAAPTKFAEYLVCGLKTILSKNIGDYSSFTEENNTGIIIEDVNSNKLFELQRPSYDEKKRMNELAKKHFTMEAFKEEYKYLLR